MALNAASHNPAGLKTGPVSGAPPSASGETTAALLDAAKNDPIGQNDGGKDLGDAAAGQKIKSEKDLEKEKKKAEKRKKFDEKKAKSVDASASAAGISKTQEKKAKQESKEEKTLPTYHEPTPPGEKKSKCYVTQ